MAVSPVPELSLFPILPLACAPAALVRVALWAAMQGPAIPAPTGMVNDFAGVLAPATVERLERLARAVRTRSGGEIAVVTLTDLGGRDVADVALAIGRTWKVGANAKVGDRTRNAGVVLLLVPKETSADGKGHISIQTGQGSEGFITDAMAGDIRREALPFLRAARYDDALTLMTRRLASRFEAEFGFTLDSADLQGLAPVRGPPVRRRSSTPVPVMAFFAVILVAFVLLALLSSRGRRRGYGGPIIYGGGWGSGGGWSSGSRWSSGSNGGGGGGFDGFGGGGGFSGGGSSGDW